MDARLSLELVQRQVETFVLVAQHLHLNGLTVYIREGTEGGLRRFVTPDG